MAAHHLIFEVCLIMNTIVGLVYWSVLYESEMKKNEGDAISTRHSLMLHSLPLVSCLVNFLITDIVMVYSHFKGMLLIGFVYMVVNYLVYLTTGTILYWFLDW